MSQIDLGTVLQADSNLTIREIGDETIIVSEKVDTLHTLNSVGQVVWRQLDGRKPLRVVLDQVCDEYSVSRAVAENDLLDFVSQLAQKGLVHVIEWSNEK
jgi:hypothetical protein